MRQLLEYGMRLAKDEKQDGDEDDEAREERLFMEARVCSVLLSLVIR